VGHGQLLPDPEAVRRPRYRVVHEDSGWVSLGQVILDAPP